MLLLTEQEIRDSVDMAEAIDVVEKAFAALARGQVTLPPPIGLDIPDMDAEVHVKGAYIHDSDHFVFKLTSGFYRNPQEGLPMANGLVLAFDATHGQPAALLFDNGYLSDLRTGAAGAVVARHLAPQQLRRVAVIGAGEQARMQLRALSEVRTIPGVALWNRSPERARQCAADMTDELGLDVQVVERIEDAVQGSNAVITVTTAREPLVRAEWIEPGTHVTAVGSDGPDKQELDVEVLHGADLVVADRLSQCIELGEIHHAVDAGRLQADACVELGAILIGEALGRETDDQITVADLTGLGVQDAAIASATLNGARGKGFGTTIES
ncbi:MAG TPA: ornithine cyclodeaminase family protein [Acidobacteriota bacterium]|nr:ornithine cyclodeaminase family protein [Acidobacteriota bacterium]